MLYSLSMKRTPPIFGLCLYLPALCIIASQPLSVIAGFASGNAYLGYYTPVLQPEANDGIVAGVSSRIKIAATLYMEPYFFQIQEVDQDIASGGETIHRGTTISSLGGNIIVGAWLNERARPYALVGIGMAQVRPGEEAHRSNRFCSNWGAGMEYTLMPTRLFLDLSARLLVIQWNRSTSLKSILLLGGLNWYFPINL